MVGGSSPSTRAVNAEPEINFKMKEKVINYFKDIAKEMKKVSWPTKDQLRDYTKIVILTMIIMSIFVYIVDKGVSEILKVIF